MRTLYELNNVEQVYEGRKVLSIENLTLEENQIIGFFGPNGSGKSTLFSLLAFADSPTQGNIMYNGIDGEHLDLQMRQGIVMVPQNPYLLKRSVYDNVAYGLKLRKDKYNVKERVHEALTMVGLESDFAKRKWSQLSGGEAQRVALAARLILKPKVLILDEPTTGVDTNSAQLIKEAIFTAKQKWNTTLFISSHDHNWLNHACDRKVALFQGNLVESGSVNLLFAPWEKDEDGNLIKFFADGQCLTIENSQDKKRDSVCMLDSAKIEICRKDCHLMFKPSTLIGVISSIQQQHSVETLLVEFMIGGVRFNTCVGRDVMQAQRFLPDDRVYVNLDTSAVTWI